jgi:23S rRNA (adenine2030-N6)-methyltransferase
MMPNFYSPQYERTTLLSYRHGYHAGNHADLLKHTVLCLLLKKLIAKDSPCIYIDTHAGAGSYDLNEQWAQKTAEFLDGIERFLSHETTPPLAAEFIEMVVEARISQPLAYPGSPAIAQRFLRPQDKLILMELHNNEVVELKRRFGKDHRVSIHHRDGFEGLVGVMPPGIARGLALLDPSYELKSDYAQVVSAVQKASRRWTTGMFAVWYPLLGETKDQSKQLLNKLKDSTSQSLLVAELTVKAPRTEFGMHGSGVAIVNPPWLLDNQLEELLPQLRDILAQDEHAGCRVKWLREKA